MGKESVRSIALLLLWIFLPTLTTHPEPVVPSLGLLPGTPTNTGLMKRLAGLVPGLNSLETMQKSVLNAFSLKYSQFLNNSSKRAETFLHLSKTIYFQKWLLADLRFPMTTFRVWGSRFMECPPGFPSTLPSSTTNSSSNRFWPIWKKLSSWRQGHL